MEVLPPGSAVIMKITLKKLEGLRTVYYPSGKIAEEQFYKII
jgi:antitoxin component YwqK of YwqJK toxin-antitoxin module